MIAPVAAIATVREIETKSGYAQSMDCAAFGPGFFRLT
jgi:hypothetical protein